MWSDKTERWSKWVAARVARVPVIPHISLCSLWGSPESLSDSTHFPIPHPHTATSCGVITHRIHHYGTHLPILLWYAGFCAHALVEKHQRVWVRCWSIPHRARVTYGMCGEVRESIELMLIEKNYSLPPTPKKKSWNIKRNPTSRGPRYNFMIGFLYCQKLIYIWYWMTVLRS